jgi:AbrB family looped-hinge helix DNA binding protein
MTKTVIVSTKGRVVLPKASRQQFGFAAGDLVSFELQSDGDLVRKVTPDKR